MKPLIKNKKYIILFVTLLIDIVAYSQNTKYASFRDYRIVPNIDSLEKAVRAKKNNPEQYLHGLITLELNRMDYLGWFGQDLNTIKTLAYKLRSPLAIATYQYLEGNYSIERSFGRSVRNTLTAIHYFETTKDTSGMIASYYSILFSNVLGNPFKMDSSHSSKFFYNKIISLGQKSSALRDKVKMIQAKTNFQELIGRKYENNDVFYLIEESLRIINQNPNIEPLDSYLYANIARLYSILPEAKQLYLQKSHEYNLKLIEANARRTSTINIRSCLNTGIDYFNLNANAEAKKILLKGINAMEKLKEEERSNIMFSSLYSVLSDVQFNQKDFIASRASWAKSDAIHDMKYLKLKSNLFEELNTQFELDKKQLENNILKESNLLIEFRNKQFKTILILSLISLSIFSVLLYFLLKSNGKQKRLLLFRDQLYTIIAHDLRSPISTFQRYSDIVGYLVKTKQFDRLDTTTKQLDHIGKNLANLLNNLLAWSLNQQDLVKNLSETLKINVFFKELLPIYQDMANLGFLELIDDIDDVEVILDPNKFALIIRNMLDNAIKFSEENNQIIIKAAHHENKFVVSISNRSKASTIEQKKIIKELFESDKEYAFGANNHLGIGLILVKQYSEIMGAKITFDFDQDCLTIFRFSLPLIPKSEL